MVMPLLEAAVGGWQCGGDTLAVALKLLFEGLLWSVKQLNVDAPDEGAVQDIVLQRNTFVDTLTSLYASHKHEGLHAEVRDSSVREGQVWFFILGRSVRRQSTMAARDAFQPANSRLARRYRSRDVWSTERPRSPPVMTVVRVVGAPPGRRSTTSWRTCL